MKVQVITRDIMDLSLTFLKCKIKILKQMCGKHANYKCDNILQKYALIGILVYMQNTMIYTYICLYDFFHDFKKIQNSNQKNFLII